MTTRLEQRAKRLAEQIVDLTEKRDAAMVELYEKGGTYRQIGDIVGMPYPTVKTRLAKLGVEAHRIGVKSNDEPRLKSAGKGTAPVKAIKPPQRTPRKAAAVAS